MITDLEKNNSVLSADLEEAKRVIDGLQRERDDLQRYTSRVEFMLDRKRKWSPCTRL